MLGKRALGIKPRPIDNRMHGSLDIAFPRDDGIGIYQYLLSVFFPANLSKYSDIRDEKKTSTRFTDKGSL